MDLEKEVNRSGFPLQIAIETLIGRNRKQNDWRVIYSEHAWANEKGESGFIDLILELDGGAYVLIIECKRVLDTTWIFLNSKGEINKRKRAKVWLNNYENGRFQTTEWIDITPDPECPECEFCLVPGQNKKSAPMLERVASTLISSTESFAREEAPLFPTFFDRRFYFNVVVTTAKLNVCTFDPSSISLIDGTLKNADFHEIPFVRFRKQLQAAPYISGIPKRLFSYKTYSGAKENTVFVVNSEGFKDFLKKLDIGMLNGIL